MTSTPFQPLQEDQGSSPTRVDERTDHRERVDSPLFFDASDPVFPADPYPLYARLRAADPVHRAPHGLWILTRYADVAAVLRDPRFGREGFERHFGAGGGSGANGAPDGLADAARLETGGHPGGTTHSGERPRRGFMSPTPLGEDRRAIIVSVEHVEERITITVRDRRHGIAPDDLPRLFDSFYSTKRAGMGLGLSIARTIVEAHGGRIWADSRPGDGAVFHVELPAIERVAHRPRTEALA